MPRAWQEQLLLERVRRADDTWVLLPTQEYYALLHATLSRPDRAGEQTAQRLADAARAIGAPEVDHRNQDAARSVLSEHVRPYLERPSPTPAAPTGRRRLRAVLTARLRGR
jgi:hypothetical protein